MSAEQSPFASSFRPHRLYLVVLPDIQAKELIYNAFIEVAKHLAKPVHWAYFEPTHPAFEPRTLWSLQSAFTGAFKVLEPLPQSRATESLGRYFATLNYEV